MNFEDEEEWDLELLDKLVRSEEQAIAARRSASATQPNPLPSSISASQPQQHSHPPPLSLSLRRPAPQHPSKQDDHHLLVLDLQHRLRQAEQELSELRQKALQPTAIATSTIEKELHRLQTQIVFKDQEILEARRACTEKSEQLKRFITESEELRKGSAEIKRVKWQTNVSVETKHREEERRESAPRASKTSVDVTDSQGPQNQDLWYPPWTPSGPTGLLQGACKSKNSSPQAAQSQCTSLDREESSSVQELRARVLDNGSTSSIEKEVKTCSGQLLPVEIGKISTNGSNIQSRTETTKENITDKKSWEHPLQSDLLNIWCPRNMKEESKGLVPKILAVREADMKILLSMDIGGADYSEHLKNNRSSCEISPFTSKRTVSDSHLYSTEEVSDGSRTHSLRSILAKVAIGLVSSWNLFLAVLELSEVDNIQVSESALRVLHCILIHDEGCQNKLFGRRFLEAQTRKELHKSASIESFSKGTAGCYGSLRTLEGLIGAAFFENVLKRYFTSPRISWCNEAFPHCQMIEQDMSSQKNRIVQMNERNSDQNNSRSVSFVDCNQGAWLARIFKGVLFKAVEGSSKAIKITAVSILVALVMNTEPMSEREYFGFILFDGSIASLFRISAGLDVRLQAVRLVHSLLHCPPVLRKLLLVQEQFNHELPPLASKQSEEISGPIQDSEFDVRNAEESVFLQNGKENSAHSEAAGPLCNAEGKSSLQVLEGLISCILHVSSSSQAYSLRRNALRVLTFVATSGQEGAAFLLVKEMALTKAEIGKKASDNAQDSKSPALTLGSLPVHLIVLLDQELKMEEEGGGSIIRSGQIEEREYVIHETLTLLCRLASHSTQSANTLAAITADENIARLSISVTNRLMSRGSSSGARRLRGRSSTSPVDVIELSRGLRRRILASISTL